MTSAPGVPVGMKCHGSLLYVAAGSSVVAIDLRTMQKVITAALFLPKLYSFEITPLKSMICTGAIGKAMLWDIRKNQGTLKPEPVAELDGHQGSITLLHMDSYKIITGGPEDPFVNVWEAGSGRQTNSLLCCSSEAYSYSGCTAMAVKVCQIVTASCGEAQGLLCFRDFASAGSPALTHQDEPLSKFWGPQSNGDSDSDGSDG
ncbi:uncharacterized protein LOC131168679 isoform X2 [Malania oleifera]|nr:uncharacterized protein LOC131168679 isoform X2 [Malania oleifera]